MVRSKEKLLVSWEDFGILINKLTDKIKSRDVKRPDFVIGIARGGIPVSIVLCEKFGAEFDFFRVKSYSNSGKHTKPKISAAPSSTLSGKVVFIVDDIADSGDTFKAVLDYLKNKGLPKKIFTASLFVKPTSVFIPDAYVEKTDKWVVFPWET
jgi:hypoxanthine phosphoribosyltransferase